MGKLEITRIVENQRFGNFDMSVEWARLLVDQGASVLQLDNDKRLITFSTKEARAKNLEWKTIQEQKEEEGDSDDGITWSLPEMEILAITVSSDLANTTDYIPIVCKSDTLCRPVTEEEMNHEIDESLTIDGNTRQNVALEVDIKLEILKTEKNAKKTYGKTGKTTS